jgi:hypothetical protein
MSPVTAIIFHGRHKKISLNFQINMLTAASPNMALVSFGSIKIQCQKILLINNPPASSILFRIRKTAKIINADRL